MFDLFTSTQYTTLALQIVIGLLTGATVLSIVIAVRAKREIHSTIFSLVKEEEVVRLWKARLAIVLFWTLTITMTWYLGLTWQTPSNVLTSYSLAKNTPDVENILATHEKLAQEQVLAEREATNMSPTKPIVIQSESDIISFSDVPTEVPPIAVTVILTYTNIVTSVTTLSKTHDLTETATALPSHTPTLTPISTSTPTSIPTQTQTPTITLTATSVPTQTPTPTITLTKTATSTPTQIPKFDLSIDLPRQDHHYLK